LIRSISIGREMRVTRPEMLRILANGTERTRVGSQPTLV